MLQLTASSQAKRPLHSAPISRRGLTLIDAATHGQELEALVLNGLQATAKATRPLPTPAHHIKDCFRAGRAVSLANFGRAMTMLARRNPSAFRKNLVRPLAAWLHAIDDVPAPCVNTAWIEGERLQGKADNAQRAVVLDSTNVDTLSAAIDATSAELFATRTYLSALIQRRADVKRGTVKHLTLITGNAS